MSTETPIITEEKLTELKLLTMQLAFAARDALRSWSDMKLTGNWKPHQAAMAELRAALVAFSEDPPVQSASVRTDT